MPYADPAQQRKAQREWVARRRAAYFDDKVCAWCGADEDLHLHHRDPSKKESHAIWSWGEARRLAEIAKCIVLCVSCHRRAHGEARRVEAELRNAHGTRNRYDLGCRCDACKTGKRVYNEEHPPRLGDAA